MIRALINAMFPHRPRTPAELPADQRKAYLLSLHIDRATAKAKEIPPPRR